MRFGTFRKAAGVLTLTIVAAATTQAGIAQPGAGAQPAAGTPAAQPDPGAGPLQIPQDVNFVGTYREPNVARASAIVNEEIITRTDIDHRLALEVMTRQLESPTAEQIELLRGFVLRNLIDEALQIQTAKAREITIERGDIDRYFARYAQSLGHTPGTFNDYLRTIGSSERSVKRQIEGELAWSQLQRRLPRVSVTDAEIDRTLADLRNSRGMREYRPFELFMYATPENAAQVRQRLSQIVQQVRAGAPFQALARQYGETTVAALGGDLGWVRAEQLPPEISSVMQQMPPGGISEPIQLPDGFSVIVLADTRQIGMADPRDAQVSLIQISVNMPSGTSRELAEQRANQLGEATATMGGCGNAQATAARFGAEIVSAERRVRDMPEVVQPTLLRLRVGEATPPFGSPERFSVLVMCGRDDPPPVPELSREDVEERKDQERMNRQAARLLRDLRRDAVIEYR